MALIPGSYARAAGLQSEINKVTVTRIAGSEVQFRRTIDTYQRDLRYNVNQIGREQRQLRRSMRRYMRKLHDSKKQRQQRAAKTREDHNRLKLTAQQFEEAKQAVNTEAVAATASDGAGEEEASPPGDPHSTKNIHNLKETFSDSPDSGLGGDVDVDVDVDVDDAAGVDSSPAQQDRDRARRLRKAFLTSGKGTLPYFKAKRGQAGHAGDGRHGHGHVHRNGHGHKAASGQAAEESDPLQAAGDHDALLPVINEENEEMVDQSKTFPARTLHKETGGVLPISSEGPFQDPSQDPSHGPSQGSVPPADNSTPDADSDSSTSHSKAPLATTRSKLTVVASLDTKAYGKPRDARHATSPSKDAHIDDESRKHSSTARYHDEGNEARQRPRKARKAGSVSYADLIKLQHTHTSSSKQLFRLVDRLASVHGIVDPPPMTASSRASSLDPRAKRLKQKGRGSQPLLWDGMVRQAAVLYPIKYGYSVPDGDSPTEPPPSFLPISLQLPPGEEDPDLSGVKESGVAAAGDRLASRRDSLGGVLDAASHRLSVTSARRHSTDVTSPFYEFSEVASSIFSDMLPDTTAGGAGGGTGGGGGGGEGGAERRASRSRTRTRQSLSLAQLSRKASEVRDRTLLQPPAHLQHSVSTEDTRAAPPASSPNRQRHDSLPSHHNDDLEASPPPSPVPRRSRSLSRSRRASVHSQLQRRLNEDSEGATMAWQSAFGRLKVLHTLYDLSQHFAKDTQ